MNLNAAFKTLLVVLGIGAVTGFNEWRHVYGGTPEEQAKREIAQCIRDREQASYQTSMFTMGREAKAQKDGIKSECEKLVRGGGLILGTPSAAASGPATAAPKPAERKAAKPAQHTAAPADKPASVSNRRELCLTRIEEARQRSPGGLNPEWEQDQRNRCDAQ